MTMHLLLKGDSLEALKAQVIAEHGLSARIIKAESVVQGGIGGFLAKRYFEVTVEIPSPAAPPATAVVIDPTSAAASPVTRGMVLPNRSGIAALLADADEAEDRLADPLTLSTSSERFDQLFDELSTRVSPAPVLAIAPPQILAGMPPLPLRGAGDLVVLIGLRTDAMRVAHSLSGRFGRATVCVGGSIALKSALTVSDRRSALLARADGVDNGCGVFVAYGIEPEIEPSAKSDIELGIEPGTDWAAELREIAADQVWVVVDAGRKHEDTQLWVGNVTSVVGVDAVAAFGLATTLTPETVQDLGIPVGWADGLLLGR